MIPNLNGGKYLEEAIESALSQSVKCNVFVVDNNSHDNSLDILKKYKENFNNFDYMIEYNQGISNALNSGLNEIDSEFIARLDSDDIMFANRIEEQLRAFDNDENLVLVGSNIELIDATGISIGTRKYPLDKKSILKSLNFMNPIAHPSVLINKNKCKNELQYNSKFDGAEDLELWLRIKDLGNFLNLDKQLTKYRIHSSQETNRRNLYRKELAVRLYAISQGHLHLTLSGIFRIMDLVLISLGQTWHRKLIKPKVKTI